jgi:hypothetical protein
VATEAAEDGTSGNHRRFTKTMVRGTSASGCSAESVFIFMWCDTTGVNGEYLPYVNRRDTGTPFR